MSFRYCFHTYKRIIKIAEEQDIKIYDFFLSDVALRWDLNLDDGIHPNAEGYRIISENIFDFLEDEDVLIKRKKIAFGYWIQEINN